MEQEIKNYREMAYSDVVEPVYDLLLPKCLRYLLTLAKKRADIMTKLMQDYQNSQGTENDQDDYRFMKLCNAETVQKTALGFLIEIYRRKNNGKIEDTFLSLDCIAFDQQVFDEAGIDWSFFEEYYFNFAYYFSHTKLFLKRGLYHIDNEFAWLLLKAFSPTPDKSVYVQNCGLGLIPALLHECFVEYSDTHKEALALTTIFRDASIRYSGGQQNEITNYSRTDGKYDQIIYISDKLNSEIEDPEIEELNSKLDEEGRMAIVVRTSWLSKPFESLDETGICHLYKKGYIKRIIQLNKDIFPGTTASISIIIVDKAKCNVNDIVSVFRYKSIKMTDLTDEFDDLEYSYKQLESEMHSWLDHDWRYDFIDKGENPLDAPYDYVTVLVDSKDIKCHNGILVPALYMRSYYVSPYYPLAIMSPIVHTDNIEDVDVVCEDSLTSIFPYAPVTFDWRSIFGRDGSALWYKGPAAFFYRDKGKTFTGFIQDDRIFECPKKIYVIKAKDAQQAQYFAGHLQAWDTQKQIEAIDAYDNCFGNYPEHFSSIRFDAWEDYQDFIDSKMSSYFDAVNKKLNDSFEQYQKEVHIRKHALSQVVSPLAINTNILIDYLKSHNHHEISMEDRVKKFRHDTVLDIINSITRNLSILEQQTVHLAEIEYKWSEPVEIDPQIFISDYIANNKNSQYEFVYDDSKLNQRVLQDGSIVKDAYFDFPTDALNQIMSDIISNAVSHGFKDKSRNDYKIELNWGIVEYDVVISIKNNGSPIHPDFDIEDIFTYGVSSAFNDEDGHSGIGCYDIKNIIERQGGSVEVKRLSGGDFTVEYRLSFPNKRK